MKLGKLAAGATALALSLALVPSMASAAESASSDTKFGFWSDAQKTQSLYYSTKMTVSAARDLNALHYGDKLKVTFSKVTNPEKYDHSPESATANLGVFTKEMSFGKAEGNQDEYKTSIPAKTNAAISNTADTSFDIEIPCSLKQQKYFVSSNLSVSLSEADQAGVTPMQALSNDPERIYANIPFTINDPEGAAKCAADGKAKPGKDSQPAADPDKTSTPKTSHNKSNTSSNNKAEKVEQQPMQKGNLADTGAIALLVSALAGTLVAAGSGITYLSRRSKQ